MRKSREKILSRAALSVAVIACLAVPSQAIADSSEPVISMSSLFKRIMKPEFKEIKVSDGTNIPLPNAKPFSGATLIARAPAPSLKPDPFKNLSTNVLARKAQIYFYKGQHEKALKFANAALTRTAGQQPIAGWVAGMVNWRAGDYEHAAKNFSVMGASGSSNKWARSAGAFWAARSYMRANDSKNSYEWYKRAAQNGTTFYGLLARETLGNRGDISGTGQYKFIPAGWVPKEGFQLSESLITAIIMQESRFNPKARSKQGARGLMQILPSTASFTAGHGNFDLNDPAMNISVGQSYLSYLLEHENVGGNLITMLVAYNGGPGNLAKWKRIVGDMNDPLYFIESIPSGETRAYVERVMSNYWIYDIIKEGRTPSSLAVLSKGKWPRYESANVQFAAR